MAAIELAGVLISVITNSQRLGLCITAPGFLEKTEGKQTCTVFLSFYNASNGIFSVKNRFFFSFTRVLSYHTEKTIWPRDKAGNASQSLHF